MSDGISQSDFEIGQSMLAAIEPEKPRQPDGKFAKAQPEPPAEEAPEETQEQEPETEQPEAPESEEEEIAGREEDAGDEPSIPPPSSLTADEKELFLSLPPEAQKMVARRERERTAEIHRLQSKQSESDRQLSERMKIVENERQQLFAQMQQYGSQVEAEFQQKFGNVTDPMQLASEPQKQLEYLALQAKVNKFRHDAAIMQHQMEVEAQQKLQQFRAQENEKLVELMPSLADPERGAEFERTVVGFLTEQGYPIEAIQRTSAKDLLIAHDAYKWRQAEAKRKAAEKSQRPVPKVMRPGTKGDTTVAQERAKSAAERLAKTGRVEDAAAWFRTQL